MLFRSDVLTQHTPGLLILPAEVSTTGTRGCTLYPTYAACLRQGGVPFAMAHTLISCNVFRRERFDFARAVAMRRTWYGHMFGLVDGLSPDAPVAVLDGVVRLRPAATQLAQRKHWQIFACLCVKMAIYLWHLSTKFGVSGFRVPAIRLALNLPIEIAAWSVRRIPPLVRRK